MKKYKIFVKYNREGSELHITNWGSEDLERAIANANSMMEVIEKNGKYRFAGVQVFDADNKLVCHLERDKNEGDGSW